MPNPTNSPFVTSQKQHVRPQHGFPTSKRPESNSTEPEITKNNEDGHESQSLLAQKKLQVQNFPGNPSFNPNFPIMVTGQGGEQLQQPNDPALQMGMNVIDVAGRIPPGHGMLQPLPDIGHNHYQLGNLSNGWHMGFKWIFLLSLALLQAAYYRRLKWSIFKSRRLVVDVVN